MQLLLYELLPLRTARMLGDYADDAPLPHVYGDLTTARFPLVRISDTRGLAADHPMEITAAYVGDTATSSWSSSVEPDARGSMCTFVDFGAPVASGVPMAAAGRGKRSPLTGGLITNPGEVLEDVARIAGRSDSFQQLREECAATGLAIAGRVASLQSIRGQFDAIAESAGAIWAPAMSRRYPTITRSGSLVELTRMTASGLRVSATVEDTADLLRLGYDVADATGKPQHYLELTASPQRFGGAIKELSLPWLRTAANAVTVGTPILQRLAGERYAVSFNSSRTDIRPGMWIKLVAHPEWPLAGDDPTIMVLSVNVDAAAGAIEISGETLMTTPTVNVTAHSVALPDAFHGALEVSKRNGVATFTVYDEQRRPLVGASVSLDGGPPKITNERGIVTFVATAGLHVLDISGAGYEALQIEVML